ncbi:hypothetical protein [Sphingobacterium sp. JB170]|uniref:hypothetical protein n=1 Tax=Sphingobacterium sp. JB170 TaxID=1434842 RepID=UPI000B354857|nr:hypothetical protein [Sphingobacterium sp. JB170]
MRNDVKSTDDRYSIVERVINRPVAAVQLSVLTSPILLNELCDIILPGSDFPFFSSSNGLY